MKHLAYRVKHGEKLRLADVDPEDSGPYSGKDDPKARKHLEADLERLAALQDRLLGEGKRALLVVLQAMDTGGKDGVLKKVFGPLDSRAVTVASFKAPSAEELAHDYLWRVHARTPARGQIVVFNRSHYEDVLVVRVLGLVPKSVWQHRYRHIVELERMLGDEGTKVVKIYLHISRDEQKRRLQERLDDSSKNWKFELGDLKSRELWDDYMEAYEDALAKTSTDEAPWWVVPANRKWYRDLAVARILVDVLEEMDPKYPKAKVDVASVKIPD